MAHEILAVKMYELDQKICRLHSRIRMGETADHAQIRTEIAALRDECTETALTLQEMLRCSRACAVADLAGTYAEIERIIQTSKEKLAEHAAMRDAEERILYAEYGLDFAIQAANHALLFAMEALDAEMTQEEMT